LAFWGQHSDIVSYYGWTKDLLENGPIGFYDRTIPDTMRPGYPPVTYYIFWLNGTVHEAIWEMLWFINLKISAFPSNLIFWWESKLGWYYLNKIAPILADAGITYVLYKIVSLLKERRSGLIAAGFFALLPPFWYSTAVWGQTDSIYILPMLLSFYFLVRKSPYPSVIFYGLAVLTKPTVLFTAPIFFFWWLKGRNLKEIVASVLIILGMVFLLYYPFHPHGTLTWVPNFYKYSLRGELDYITANAFNLWGLLYGFGEVSNKTLLLGIPLNLWGYCTYIFFLLLLVSKIIKDKINNSKYWFLALGASSFAAFMLLPAMHERYFYPAAVLLVILAALNRNLAKVFWPVVIISFVNLYHFWWYPRIPLFIDILSNKLVEKFIVFVNVFLFFYLFAFTLTRNKRSLKVDGGKNI
jgi:Gpi18-like mannosyltransferase